jgi:hypothetical protein
LLRSLDPREIYKLIWQAVERPSAKVAA